MAPCLRVKSFAAVLATMFFIGATQSAHATFLTYYGIDLAVGPNAAHPNSDNAHAAFLAQLDPGSVGTEGFEGLAAGDYMGQTFSISFPATSTTALLHADADIALSIEDQNFPNVFAISGSNWLLTSTHGQSGWFDLSFSTPIYAFGFYGTSISNNFGTTYPAAQIIIDGMTTFDLVNIPTSSIPDGSVNFFGVIATTPFSSVELYNPIPPGSSDGIGLDDITISSAAISNGIPVPATLSLLGLGIAGLGYQRRRRLVAQD